jgi:PAS domain S-box-containing protein
MKHDDQIEELREARERLEGVLSTGALGFWTWDVPKDHLVGDPNLAFLFGVDERTAAEGTTAETFIARVEPIDQPTMRKELAKVLATGGTYAIEYRVCGSDGKLRWVASRGRAELDANHEAKSLNGIVQDITESKIAAQKLLESEERLRLATEAAELGLWVWYIAEDRVTWENDRLYEILEIPRTVEPINAAKFLTEIVHPDDADSFRRAVAKTFESDKRFHFVGRYKRGNGALGWIEFTGRLKRLADGTPERMIGTAADVTENKQAEAALAEQSRLSSLGAAVGVALTRVAGLKESLQQCAQATVDHLDAAFTRIWTLSAKGDILELQASAGLYTHIDGAHARIPVGSFKIGRIAEQRRPHLTNSVITDPDVNDPGWAEREGMAAFAGYPLVVEDRLIGVLGLFARHSLGQDTLTAIGSVSATIAIAIERKRSTEELAQRAADLKRSNEDLEQFAHVASHDLRSPTNTVLQFTELMMRRQEGAGDEEMSHFLQIVRDSAKRMGELISALLTYSRLGDAETKKLQMVSSLTAYEDAVANLRIVIEGAQAKIERDELPYVFSNPTQLSQVFQNLIANAIHYRGAARPHVRISAERRTNFWMFSVTDNGPGIAPQYHSVIFEPFKRLHGSDRPGSGIGLAFCRKFIEREGGTIWVESEEGKGASFRFTLPAIERASAGLS